MHRSALLYVLASAMLAAQDPPKPTPATTETAALLDITLETARPQVVSDPRQSVIAVLRNLSKSPLKLQRKKTVFSLTPDADGSGKLRESCAIFPVSAADGSFTLPGGESTRVIWDLRSNPDCSSAATERRWYCAVDGLCEPMARAGQYKVILNALVTTSDGVEHSATHELEIPVSAPFAWIIVWSVLGGLVAYWVKGFLQLGEVKDFMASLGEFLHWKSLMAFLGNGALSGVLVVLGTQLAGAAFPIKVDAAA